MSGRNILHSSFQTAYFSIIFQILCRCITFTINAFVIRNVGREVLGIMNVRLLLLESTLLFLSREAINRAALSVRTQQTNICTWPQIVNQIWLTVPICVILCGPCLYIWLAVLSPVKEEYWNQYAFGCYAVAASCILELCAETPLFISKVFCYIKLKIVLDTLHILVRSAIFLWLVFNDKSICIFAFGVSQLSSAVVIVVGYYGYFYMTIKKEVKRKKSISETDLTDFPFATVQEMIPGNLKNDGKILNSELQILTFSFIKQGILKQVLTEGEKYVMSVSPILTFSEQATYDIINNLGSLAARYIFRPIEDSSYFYFTQTLSRGIKLKDQNQEKATEAVFVLRALCLVFTSIGLTIFVFGQNFAGIALYLYGGAEFISDSLPVTLLQWHCLAILFLAVNGITEGFMFATNASTEIDKYNVLMAIFSVSFLIFSYILTNLFGPVGFIIANCLNMFCRICYSIKYISSKFSSVSTTNPANGIIPGKYFCVALMLAWIICKVTIISYNKDLLANLSIGVVCGGLCILTWAIENKAIIQKFRNKFRTIKQN